jgi:hypothetical protein
MHTNFSGLGKIIRGWLPAMCIHSYRGARSIQRAVVALWFYANAPGQINAYFLSFCQQKLGKQI